VSAIRQIASRCAPAYVVVIERLIEEFYQQNRQVSFRFAEASSERVGGSSLQP
jgi:hypothetical protein